MTRILTLAATGLFMAGLAVLPISGNAAETSTGSKGVTSAPAASTMTPDKGSATSGTQHSATPVKKDDKTTTASPGGTAPAGGTTVKTPAKNPS